MLKVIGGVVVALSGLATCLQHFHIED